MDAEKTGAGLFFVVGAAQPRCQRRNSVFLRCATTLRQSGANRAPVFIIWGPRLSVRQRQPHQPGVTESKQFFPRIGAAQLDIYPPYADGHLRGHFE